MRSVVTQRHVLSGGSWSPEASWHNSIQAFLAHEAAGPELSSTAWLRGETTTWGTQEMAQQERQQKEGVAGEAGAREAGCEPGWYAEVGNEGSGQSEA